MSGISSKSTRAARRRRRAVARVLAGRTQAAVARRFGVHAATVSKWMARYRAAGKEGLANRPKSGRPRHLTPTQEAQVLGWLAQKPTDHGFRTDLWSARRIVELVRREFGVAFHPASLRRWLRDRGYVPRRPFHPPWNGDNDAVTHWVVDEGTRVSRRGLRLGSTPT